MIFPGSWTGGNSWRNVLCLKISSTNEVAKVEHGAENKQANLERSIRQSMAIEMWTNLKKHKHQLGGGEGYCNMELKAPPSTFSWFQNKRGNEKSNQNRFFRNNVHHIYKLCNIPFKFKLRLCQDDPWRTRKKSS